MDKGHAFILKYIENLEDQLLCDNYPVGKELTRYRQVVAGLLDWMFHAKNVHEINEKVNEAAYAGYKILESSVPEQKLYIDAEEEICHDEHD